jgi:signal transduction histidine kinase
MTAPDWHIVLSRDGTVLESEGAPQSWVGTRLVDRDDVPDDLKQAGRAATEPANPHATGTSALSLGSGPHVHLAVVDAVPLHRLPTDIRNLLRSSLDFLRRQADAADIALSVRVVDAVPGAVLLDRGKIAWAVTALVGNALRYVRRGSQTMPGGSIAVLATYEPAARQIVIEVQDDGAGIPPDRLSSLFGGNPESPGTALGLTMVRDVVAAHGGTLTVTSSTDAFSHGTTVGFTLPVG